MYTIENRTNYGQLIGRLTEEPKRRYEIEGEGFYESFLEIKRLSDVKDIIPITISERVIHHEGLPKAGDEIAVVGEYRSYNKPDDAGKSRLMLHFFVQEYSMGQNKKVINLSEYDSDLDKGNGIKLVGYVCKPPVYRTTPFNREICDILLAVNRSYGERYSKSDYIPCIVWGRNARFMKEFGVGTKLEVAGRIQSRDYSKKLPDGSEITRTAYEVSCFSLNVLENDQSKLKRNEGEGEVG